MMTPASPPSSASAEPASHRHAPPLRIVVADDHHHVLPEIHVAIRRRVLPFHGVHVVHFDAHPDLSFSSVVDPALVFRPDELYDALDESPSGIAEFLLPLVYAGHVDRVTWVKSPWATQMTTGAARGVAIGRHAASEHLALSCAWPHFIDDELYAPQSEMDATTVKLWDLEVAEPAQTPSPSSPWILDVDLDFFSTWNPFRKDLEAQFDAQTLTLLTDVFTKPRCRVVESDLPPEERTRQRKLFTETMDQVKELELYLHPASAEGRAAIETLSSLCSLEHSDGEKSAQLLEEFLTLLANLDEQRRALVWHAAPCLDLPHHEAQQHEIESLLSQFRSYLVSNPPPSLVTIATSVTDRFLPLQQLDFVRDSVLEIVSQVYHDVQIDYIEYEPV